jgi:hypothetical protein
LEGSRGRLTVLREAAAWWKPIADVIAELAGLDATETARLRAAARRRPGKSSDGEDYRDPHQIVWAIWEEVRAIVRGLEIISPERVEEYRRRPDCPGWLKSDAEVKQLLAAAGGDDVDGAE